MDIALRWWTSPHLEMPRNAFQTNVQIAEKSGNSLKGKMPKRAVSKLSMIKVTEWMRTETLCEGLKDIWITYFFEGHKFWLILMSTNLETPTNHALVGHIWPQTWKPQKNTYLCSFSSKGSSVRMPSLQTWEGNCHQVATKCVRQALTMYTIVFENLVACFVNVEYELFLKSDHCICKDRIANVHNCTCTILSKCKGLPICLWMKIQFFKRLPRKLLPLSFTWVLFYLLVTTIGANVDTDTHFPEIHPCRYFGKTLQQQCCQNNCPIRAI